MSVVKMTDSKGAARMVSDFTLFEPYEIIRRGVSRKRTLRFDLNALADFEQEVGMGFAQLMNKQAVFAVGRALIWAGLKHEDRGLSIERVGDLMGQAIIGKTATLNDFVTAAMKAAADQGALGDVQQSEVPETQVSDPNDDSLVIPAVALPQRSGDAADPGQNGSPEPNQLDTARSN